MVLSLSPLAESQKPALITSIELITYKENAEVRIEADHALSIRSMVLTHPHRIVLDAAGALFKTEKFAISNDACPVKSVHTDLLRSQSSVARIVIDTCAPPTFTLRSEGNSVYLDIGRPSVRGNSDYAPVENSDAEPNVTFDQGLLSIVADNSTLTEVIRAVQRKIGARIEFPSLATNEHVAVKLGPARPARVLVELLDEQHLDYAILERGPNPTDIYMIVSQRATSYNKDQALSEPTQTSAGTATAGYIWGPAVSIGSDSHEQNRADAHETVERWNGTSTSESISGLQGKEVPPDPQPQRVRRSRENPRYFPDFKSAGPNP